MQEELNLREAEFRENYASVLRVPPELLFFVSMKDPLRVEAVRCLLFAHLRFLSRKAVAPDLALRLVHKDQGKDLMDLRAELDLPLESIGSACASLLESNQRISAEALRVYARLANRSPSAELNQTLYLRQRSSDANILQAELLAPMCDMGFKSQIVAMVIEELSRPDGENERYTAERDLARLVLEMEASTDTDANALRDAMSNLLPAVIHCVIEVTEQYDSLISLGAKPEDAMAEVRRTLSGTSEDDKLQDMSPSEARDRVILLPDEVSSPLLSGKLVL